MNISNFEHVFYALLIQAAVWVPTRSWRLGAMLAIGLFIGREHAQREYNNGGPSKLSPWEAFDVWNWSLDAQRLFIINGGQRHSLDLFLRRNTFNGSNADVPR